MPLYKIVIIEIYNDKPQKYVKLYNLETGMKKKGWGCLVINKINSTGHASSFNLWTFNSLLWIWKARLEAMTVD